MAHVVAMGLAHADGPIADDLAVRESGSLFHDPGEPRLRLDVIPRPAAIGLGVVEDTHRIGLRRTKRATITLGGTAWTG